ncbi:MAG: glycosyltransferase family 2 protein [Planctomycetota bacterium]
MTRPSLLSMVLPAYNERASIVTVLEQVRAALDRLPIQSEVVVVDDGSKDGTGDAVAEVADRLGVRLVRNPVNLGYGHSLLRGVTAARGDLLGIMDADQTYPADQIPALFDLIDRGADHAIGRRTGQHLRSWWSMRHVYRWLCGYVSGEHVADANSGLRLFKREIVEDLRGDLCLGFSFTTSLTLASLLSGYVVAFHDIPYNLRAGRSHVRFKDILRTLQYLFQLVAVYNPLKLFLPLVLLNSLLAAAALAYGLWLERLVAMLSGVILSAGTLLLIGLAALSYIVSRTGLQTARTRLRRSMSVEEPSAPAEPPEPAPDAAQAPEGVAEAVS